MIVGLPIEISKREFYPKFYLAEQIISKSNFSILIGQKSLVYSAFKNMDSIFLLSKGGPSKKFLFKKKNKKNFFSILDEEGPLINLSKTDFHNRCDKKIMKFCDFYFTWGKRDQNRIIKLIPQKKILNFGHPKFDYIKKNIFFSKERKIIKNRFKKFILFSSNFNIDQINNNLNYNAWKKKSINKKYLENKIHNKNILSNYLKTINVISSLASKNHKLNFVYRIHPREDIKLVKKRFKKKPKNLFIVKNFAITPYIQTCEIFIHAGCTTSIEASIIGKKIIYLRLFDYKKKFFYKKMGYVINTEKQIENLFAKNINRNVLNNLNDIISNLNVSFSEKFVNFLNKNIMIKKIDEYKFLNFFKKKKKNKIIKLFSLLKEKIEKSFFLLNFISYISSDILLSKKYKKNKFENLNSKRVKSFFKENKYHKIIKLCDNLFLIKNLKNLD